jgi:hypothetical protein|tara:strand:- start:890 stop:1141 length:252 start_codon:yes stop_codon:yes gene_type:complete
MKKDDLNIFNSSNDLNIIRNDIYDTAEAIKEDTLMLAFLRNKAEAEKRYVFSDDEAAFVSRIADRFEKLTSSAHNRKHWTGHE